jgi:hypothetical protein
MSTQEVTIQVDQNTFTALANGGFQLYGLIGVQCSDRGGLPAVWLRTQNFSLTTRVAVPDSYAAFTAPAMGLAPGSRVDPWFKAPIQNGQVLEVSRAGGTGSIKSDGEQGAMTILNLTNTQYTCGLFQNGGTAGAPICGFELYGGGIELITPLPSVLFLFSTVVATPGTLVEVSKGPGILINLANDNSPTVSFDINQGWSWGNYAWGQAVPANSDLRPLLIQYSDALADMSAKMKERSMHMLG